MLFTLKETFFPFFTNVIEYFLLFDHQSESFRLLLFIERFAISTYESFSNRRKRKSSENFLPSNAVDSNPANLSNKFKIYGASSQCMR